MAVILDDLCSAGVSTARRVVEEAASDLHKTAAGALSDAEERRPSWGKAAAGPGQPSFIHSFIQQSFAECVPNTDREEHNGSSSGPCGNVTPQLGGQSQTKKERA